MKQLFTLLLLLPLGAFCQQYSYDERISTRSGGPMGTLNENANGTSYNVSAANSLFYVGSEEKFGPRTNILPITARINYRIRLSSGPTTGTYSSLTISERTTTGDSWLYRGADGGGCNCPVDLDLFAAAPGNGTFTLETFISVQQTDGNTFNGKPQAIVFTVTNRGALPVGLSAFSLEKSGRGVLIQWATAWEAQNSRFEVERSPDLLAWQRVATAEGGGNTTTQRTYTAQDPAPPKGINYYRLRQLDTDGRETLSKAQSITVEANPVLALYPTLTTGPLTVRGVETTVDLGIYDLLGTLRGHYGLETDTILDLSGLPNGLYIIRSLDMTQVRSQRILVQH